MTKQDAAVIIEGSGKTFEHLQEPGIMECLLEHEIKATKAIFTWKGPKITQEQWAEMLAFFKWTYDNHKSEAQVRLFIHPTLGWKIWAFPQNGATSMTTKEVDNEDSRLQRSGIPEGYVPFGTVHHHCAMGAFQSGTDREDENSVDGLHITVGKMDEDQFDIHCRLYIKKNKFEPNMSSFWDVGEDINEKTEWLASLKYSTADVLNREARYQMCIPPPAEVTFPELWKTNYILPAPVTNAMIPGTWCYVCQRHATDHTAANCPELGKEGKKGKRRKKGNRGLYTGAHNQGTATWWDEKTWDDLMESAKENKLNDGEVMKVLEWLGGPDANPFITEVVNLASDNYKTLSDMYELALEKMAAGNSETAQERIEADNAAGEGMAAKTEKEIIEFYRGGYSD